MLQLRPAVARTFSLPSSVKGDHIVATFDNASRKALFQGEL